MDTTRSRLAPRSFLRSRRRVAALPFVFLIAALLSISPVFASTPSGEVTFGKTVIEPAYDDATGTLVYLSTPMNVVVHPVFARNVAPIYLPVYPVGSAVVTSSTLNCQHVPVENCPDHGNLVAGAAQAISTANGFGSVYAGGVLGHDHLVGIASTGGDFNILWLPTLVLFTNSAAANEHVTTLAQLNAAVAAGDAIEIPVPSLTFNCAVVSAAVYAHGASHGYWPRPRSRSASPDL
jgi:hypothetical protein